MGFFVSAPVQVRCRPLWPQSYLLVNASGLVGFGGSSGCPKIDRHFSGGFVPRIVSARGTVERPADSFRRPSGMRLHCAQGPGSEAPGYFQKSLRDFDVRVRFRCKCNPSMQRMRRLWRFLELGVGGAVLEGSTREGSRLEAHSSKTKNPLIACLGRARVGNQWVYRFSLLTLLFSGVNEDTLTRGTPPCVRFYKTLPCGSDAQKLHKFC